MFCGLTYKLAWRMIHVHLRRICMLLLLDGLFSGRSIWASMQFKCNTPLLIFCLENLFTVESEVFPFGSHSVLPNDFRFGPSIWTLRLPGRAASERLLGRCFSAAATRFPALPPPLAPVPGAGGLIATWGRASAAGVRLPVRRRLGCSRRRRRLRPRPLRRGD